MYNTQYSDIIDPHFDITSGFALILIHNHTLAYELNGYINTAILAIYEIYIKYT